MLCRLCQSSSHNRMQFYPSTSCFPCNCILKCPSCFLSGAPRNVSPMSDLESAAIGMFQLHGRSFAFLSISFPALTYTCSFRSMFDSPPQTPSMSLGPSSSCGEDIKQVILSLLADKDPGDNTWKQLYRF